MRLQHKLKNVIVLLVIIFTANFTQAQDKAKVVATASMIADMAKQIAGDKLTIECIVPIGGDPHLHTPTPRDVKLVAAADLILKNGLTFEGWLSELIENSGTKGETILVTKGVKAIESTTYKNSADPHAWMDLTSGYVYIKNIRDAFIKLDPENKSFYEKQHKKYRKQLEETHIYIQKLVETIPKERRILITSHDAFQYYGRQYGIQLEAVMGISTDVDVQTSDIIRLNKVIKSSGVPA
ncbi:MAG: metal ABC transporter solute-binding protein, Zn/Mn family, partial [Saprospiraceae bacterium]